MRTLLDLMQAAPSGGVQLASLGQRYQNYPVATFDERFGPYPTGPITDQDALRLFLQQQMLGRDPEVVVPGSRSFPAGYTRI